MNRVVFITVEYNNPADTQLFLKSVARLSDHSGCEVVVVDNSDSPRGERSAGLPADLALHILRPSKNLYYWGGAAFALDSLYGASGPWPDWVVVCNNDIEVIDSNFVEILESLDPATHPIVAPAILSQASGKDQNPLLEEYPGWMKRMKWRLYDVSYPIAKSLLAVHSAGSRLRKITRRSPDGIDSPPISRGIYAPHGACMIFSSAFFEKGGKLDTEVPLFAEELTVAALAEKLGMVVWYCPEIRVSHREHSTIGATLTRKKYGMEQMARRRFYNFEL